MVNTIIVLESTLIAATPLLLAVVGESLNERAGLVNLGLEGVLLAGAASSALGMHASGNAAIAYICAAVAGGILGVAHAALVQYFRLAVLPAGLILFFFGRGTSALIGHRLVGQPLGSDVRGLPVLVWVAPLVAILLGAWLRRSRIGLWIRASGEDENRAYASGVPITRLRLACSAVGGALAGVGGGFLCLEIARTWMEGITGGRGWLAIGLVVMLRREVTWAAPLCYAFGAIYALQFEQQARGVTVSPYALSALPYVLTILALAFWRLRGTPRNRSRLMLEPKKETR